MFRIKKIDPYSAASLTRGGDTDPRGQRVGELLLQTLVIAHTACLGAQGRGHFVCVDPQGLAHQTLTFPDREPSLNHLVGQLDLPGAVQREERPRVAHVEIAREQHGLYRFGQLQKAKQVAGGRP